MSRLLMIVIVLVFGLRIPFPQTLFAHEQDPAILLSTAFAALNAGDIDPILSLASDDVVVTNLVSQRVKVRRGKAAVRQDLEWLVANHARIELVGTPEHWEHRWRWVERERDDVLLGRGIDFLDVQAEALIHGGKITAITYSVSWQEREKVLDARAASRGQRRLPCGGSCAQWIRPHYGDVEVSLPAMAGIALVAGGPPVLGVLLLGRLVLRNRTR